VLPVRNELRAFPLPRASPKKTTQLFSLLIFAEMQIVSPDFPPEADRLCQAIRRG
jgi:hypothetical protein